MADGGTTNNAPWFAPYLFDTVKVVGGAAVGMLLKWWIDTKRTVHARRERLLDLQLTALTEVETAVRELHTSLYDAEIQELYAIQHRAYAACDHLPSEVMPIVKEYFEDALKEKHPAERFKMMHSGVLTDDAERVYAAIRQVRQQLRMKGNVE